MRLKPVQLSHPYGYRDTIVIPMIGTIDCNRYDKSTPVEASAIFFETEGKSDMNGFSLAKGAVQFEASWMPSGSQPIAAEASD